MEALLSIQLNSVWSLVLISVTMISFGLLVWLYIAKSWKPSLAATLTESTGTVKDSEYSDETGDKGMTEEIQAELEETRKKYDELLFLNNGLENFHEILSKNKGSLKKLCSAILNYLVDYVGAVQGAIFIHKDNQSNRLDLISGFAMPEERLKNAYFEIGEGNVGACFKEKMTMDFHPLPKGYIKVGSFLGEAVPEYLLLIPVKYDVKVEGVLELSFFEKIDENKKQLIEKIAENLASFVTIIKADDENERNMKLLKEQQKELEVQKNELSQNLEELTATQENLKKQMEENKQFQKELAAQNTLLDALMDNFPDFIYFKDKDGKFLRVSKSMVSLFEGYETPEELIGKSDFDFHDKEGAKERHKAEQEIMESRVPIINQVEQDVLDGGKEQWVTSTKMPLVDENDNVIGTFGISKDITEFKRLEMEARYQAEELQSQEEELRQNMEEMQTVQEELQRQKDELDYEKSLMDALMSNVPDHIYFKDHESKFLLVSKSLANAFKLNSPEELAGKSDFDFFDDEHARPAFEAEQEIIKTKKPVLNLVEKEVKKDGSVTYVNTSKMPLYSRDGKVIGTFGISSDITDLKQMEMEIKMNNEELQAQEEELRQNLEEMQTVQEELQRQKEELDFEKSLMDALMSNVPDHIYFKDLDSKFIKVSQSLAGIFNLKNVDDLIGKSDFDFFDEEHAKPAYEGEQKIIKTKKPIINLVEKEVKKDGSVSYVNTSKMPLYNRDGKVIGTFGISSDITELKQMEMEIKMNNEELQAQEEELRQNLEEMQTIQEDMQKQMKENEELTKKFKEESILLNALLSTLPDYIYFKDKDSKFLRISNSMLPAFPYDKVEDMIGKSDFDFQLPENAEKFFKEEQKIIKTGKGYANKIIKRKTKTGLEQWVASTKLPLKDENGKNIGVFGITKDVTEIKEMEMEANEKANELQSAEEELRQNLEEMQTVQEDLLRQKDELNFEKSLMDALMNNVPDHIYFKDLDCKFIKVSQSLAGLFNLKNTDELIGRSDFDFFDEEHAKPAFEAEQKIIKTKKPVLNLVEKEVKKDGSVSYVNTSKMPLYNQEGKVIGTFGISSDITKLKNMEMEIEKKNKELKDKKKK